MADEEEESRDSLLLDPSGDAAGDESAEEEPSSAETEPGRDDCGDIARLEARDGDREVSRPCAGSRARRS